MEEIGRRGLFPEVRRGSSVAWSLADELALGSVGGSSCLDAAAMKLGNDGAAVRHTEVLTTERKGQASIGGVIWVPGLRKRMMIALDDHAVYASVENERDEWDSIQLGLPAGIAGVRAVSAVAVDENSVMVAVAGDSKLVCGVWMVDSIGGNAWGSPFPSAYSSSMDREEEMTAITFATPLSQEESTAGKLSVLLAAGLASGGVRLINLSFDTVAGTLIASNEQLQVESEMFGPISCIAWSSNSSKGHNKRFGRIAYTAGQGVGLIDIVRDTDTERRTESDMEIDRGKAERSMSSAGHYINEKAHRRLITSVSISSRDETLATAGSDGAVYLWAVVNNKIERVSTVHEENPERPVFGVTWSPQGMVLAVLQTSGAGRYGSASGIGNDAGERMKFMAVLPRSYLFLYAQPLRTLSTQSFHNLLLSSIEVAGSRPPKLGVGVNDIVQVVNLAIRRDPALNEIVELVLRVTANSKQPGDIRNVRIAYAIACRIQHRRTEVQDLTEQLKKRLLLDYCVGSVKKLLDFDMERSRDRPHSYTAREIQTIGIMQEQVQHDKGLSDSAVQKILSRSKTRDELVCPVCSASVLYPETACSGLSTSDRVTRHPISWCAISLTPLTSAVPRKCQGCGALSDWLGETEYEWVRDRSECYLCSLRFRNQRLDFLSDSI